MNHGVRRGAEDGDNRGPDGRWRSQGICVESL